MNDDDFELVIQEPPLWSSFTYWAYLYLNGHRIADSPCDTKWGARWWAKRQKKEFLRRRALGTNVIERRKV